MKRREFIKNTLAIGAAGTVLLTSKSHAKSIVSFNKLTNKDNPSAEEQKHVPLIKSPTQVKANKWFDITVNVGFMKEHPSAKDHWITMIELMANKKLVSKKEFIIGGISAPTATFKIRISENTTLEAIENCNLHGSWISEPVQITITS